MPLSFPQIFIPVPAIEPFVKRADIETEQQPDYILSPVFWCDLTSRPDVWALKCGTDKTIIEQLGIVFPV